MPSGGKTLGSFAFDLARLIEQGTSGGTNLRCGRPGRMRAALGYP